MKTRLKALATAAAATAMVLALATGCSSSGTNASGSAGSSEFKAALDTTQEVTLKVVGDYSNFEALETQFDEFNKIYPNVHLSYTKMDNYNTAVAETLNAQGEDAADLFMVSDYTFTNSKFEAVAAMAEDLSTTDVNLGNVAENLIYKNPDGSVPMLPLIGGSYGMVVNEDLLAKYNLKVPTTFSELMDCCKVLQDNGIEAPIQGSDSANSGLYYCFAANHALTKLANDSTALAKIKNGESGAAEALRADLDEVAKLLDSGYISHEANEASKDGYNNQILTFFNGDVPFTMVNTDTASGMAKRESQSEAYQANPFKYSFYTVPCSDDGSYYFELCTRGLSANKNSAHLDYANEFLRFLSQADTLNAVNADKGTVSVTGDSSNSAIYASLSSVDAAHTSYSGQISLTDAQYTAIRTAFKSVGNGTSVDEAIATLDAALAEAK